MFELQSFKKKKNEIKKSLNIEDFNEIKPATLFKIIKKDLQDMENIFTKKEIVKMLNSVFDVNINYNTYYRFSKNHLVQNQNKGVNEKDSKNKVDDINEVSTGGRTPADNEKNSDGSISQKNSNNYFDNLTKEIKL